MPRFGTAEPSPLPGPHARFLVIVGIFVAAQLGLLAIAGAALEAVDTTRAYATGESLYSKGHKRAVLDLHRYAERRDERDYADFREAIAVPTGDRVAREALEAVPPDRAAAALGFIAGGNAPKDVPALTRLLLWCRNWGPFARAVADWQEADRRVARLAALGAALHGDVAGGGDGGRILAEIDLADRDLTALEQSFLDHVAGAARAAKHRLEAIVGLTSLLLSLAGIGVAWRSFRKGVAAERAAHASEHRFRDFAEAASDWLWEAGPDLRVSYLSERFAEATGVDPATILARPVEAIGLHAGDAAAAGTFCGALEARRAFKRARQYFSLAPGGEQCWTLSGTPVHAADGRFLGYRGTGANVTAELHGQRALEQAKAEAEAASRSKSAFLAHVSHEFRTPLNAILGFSEIIRDARFGPVSARYAGYAGDIHASGSHLLALVNDILDLSKIEAGRGTLAEEPVVIAPLVDGVVSLMRERMMTAGLTWRVEVAADLPPVRADSRRVKQMLINLIANSVKFTPAGGRIDIAAARTNDGGLRLQVSDTGIGIAPHHIAAALAPFGQVENPMSRRQQGTGLGLSLTKAMAEQHGGCLTLESAEGCGTSVTIVLPPDRMLDDVA